MKQIRTRLLLLGISVFLLNACNKTGQNNLFEWDYKQAETIVYSFDQDVSSNEDINGDTLEQHVTGTAELHVIRKNDSMADVKLSNLEINAVMSSKKTGEKDTLNRKIPDLTVPNMKNNGEFIDPNTHVLYRVLFPLPKGEFGEGETYTENIKIPVRIANSTFDCKGYIKLTRKPESDFEGVKCQVFYGEFKVDDLQIPAGTVDQYMYDFYGSGTYYFDQNANRFMAADIVSFGYILYEADLEAEEHNSSVSKSEGTYHYRWERND